MARQSVPQKATALDLSPGKKIYFASDLHLGIPASRDVERAFVQWLNLIENDCQYLFLCGDLFDFWFEYRHVAPRGHVRLLGKLAQMADSGIQIFAFTGNHDMWMFGYLEQEIGLKLFREPQRFLVNGKTIEVGHGDGLGPGDKKYKFVKRMFACRFNQWLFARLHPNFSFGLARWLSRKSRIANGAADETYNGDDKEFLVQYIQNTPAEQRADIYVFGHRHLPLDMKIGDAHYINLGEWVHYRTYGVFDGEMKLLNL
ncbi:UDP-2,3-diacylglucosamine hydrolase [bioreactor metagenome]|uniref:UDP-2,3-diacylglucosamine hydrolase n=1 Tax=bioreactor metagenome TaxID=1076179 RepID=A0A644XL31_9ZZZZ